MSADVNASRLVVLFVVLHFLALTTPSVCETSGLQNATLAEAPPQRVEVGKITMRLGYDVRARNKELEDYVLEYTDRLGRIELELKARTNPTEIIDSIIQLAELEEDIADSQKEQDIPSTFRKLLNNHQRIVKEKKKEARKKLMAPLNKQFDILLNDLNEIEASGIDEVYQRKVQVLKRDLKSIKDDLQRLESSDSLNVVKIKLEKFLEDMDELKTLAKDGKLADHARKGGRRLYSGVSYYIVRYSVWLVPKIEMPKFLNYHNIDML